MATERQMKTQFRLINQNKAVGIGWNSRSQPATMTRPATTTMLSAPHFALNSQMFASPLSMCRTKIPRQIVYLMFLQSQPKERERISCCWEYEIYHPQNEQDWANSSSAKMFSNVYTTHLQHVSCCSTVNWILWMHVTMQLSLLHFSYIWSYDFCFSFFLFLFSCFSHFFVSFHVFDNSFHYSDLWFHLSSLVLSAFMCFNCSE